VVFDMSNSLMKVHIYTTNVISHAINTPKMFFVFFAFICYALKTPLLGLGGVEVFGVCVIHFKYHTFVNLVIFLKHFSQCYFCRSFAFG